MEIPDLPDADLALHHDWAPPETADAWLAALREELAWESESIRIHGRTVKVPRLVAFHGDPGLSYRYSGVDHPAEPWTPTLEVVRERVQDTAATRFNSVLANLYRDGRDSMGWHSDDEPELGREPVIASVSLGAERRFRLRRRDRSGKPLSLDLPHGSLLLMSGPTQHYWQHGLARTARSVGPRINLTFRWIRTSGPRGTSGKPIE